MFQLSDIEVVRGGRTILAIENLSIPTDQVTVVLGHNGSGKSTMVNLLAAQDKPDHGQVLFNERDIWNDSAKERARKVAYLPQKLPSSVGLSVRELVRLGRFAWRGSFGRWQGDDEAIINEAMEKTGVSHLSDTIADSLSGGERQRAWVAMLLAQKAPLLILDEPTSALDIQHQYQLMGLLKELNRAEGCGVVVILHDLNLVLRYATHVVALQKGQIAFDGGIETLVDEETLSNLYHSSIKLVDHPRPSQDSEIDKVAVVCE